jgi:uncharacterized membrane protein
VVEWIKTDYVGGKRIDFNQRLVIRQISVPIISTGVIVVDDVSIRPGAGEHEAVVGVVVSDVADPRTEYDA